MVRGYEGGWFTMNPGGDEDASIGDNTTSRFLNYYIQGQRWLYDEVGISGLYYDGFGAERLVRASHSVLRVGDIFRPFNVCHILRTSVRATRVAIGAAAHSANVGCRWCKV